MNAYAQNRSQQDAVSRVVVDLNNDLVAEVDKWGVPAGMRSRADSIRSLLRAGLDAVKEDQKCESR